MASSVRASNSVGEIVLLITPDVDDVFRRILTKFFDKLVLVDFIYGARDLYKRDWFREVFTKLHVFNASVLPYDKVLFLDLDTLVLRKVDHLFADPAPMAMENSKGRSAPSSWLRHGERMGAHCGLINTGVFMVSPNAELFDLLLKDAQESQVHHSPGMTPEQNYLAVVLGPFWSHLSQTYNFEVQAHGGVPLTHTWRDTRPEEMNIVHFSGGRVNRFTSMESVLGAQVEKPYVKTDWETSRFFSPSVQSSSTHRARFAVTEWRRIYFTRVQPKIREMCSEEWVETIVPIFPQSAPEIPFQPEIPYYE